MADANTAKDKSFEDQTPKQTQSPAPKADTQANENKPASVEPKAGKADKATNSTPAVDKSFQDDKKKVNKSIKVGDVVAYPYREAEHGKRTSKVYDLTDDTVTILAHDGQKTTIAKNRVELV